MRVLSWSALAVVVATTLACGGSQPSPSSPPAPSAEPAPTASAPAAAASSAPATADSAAPAAASASAAPATPPAPPSFDSMTKEQKLEHMKMVVAPKMAKVFQDADAKKYKSFGCQTCHGAKGGDPHKILPKLTMSNGGMEKLQKAKPAAFKFMAEKVVPEMAAALNEKPFDPATKQGFGCAGCHTVQ